MYDWITTPDNAGAISSAAAAVSAAAGLATLVLLLPSLFYLARQVRLARTSYSQMGMRQFLFDEYLGHKFLTIDEITIPERYGKSKNTTLLRLAKNAAWDEWCSDEAEWCSNSDRDRDSWQAKTACELAQVLENIGQATITGALPVEIVLAFFGNTIVEDWLLCRHWVKGHRLSRPVYKGNVAFHRRHAEWIALVCALWMKEWGHEKGNLRGRLRTAMNLINEYGGEREARDHLN